MERKECNAKGNMPKTKLYFSYVLLNFHQKIIDIKCDYLKKQRNLFKNDFFERKLKNISKGLRSTKMSSCNLTSQNHEV